MTAQRRDISPTVRGLGSALTIAAPPKMQLFIWLFVFALITTSAFPGDAAEQENKKKTNRGESMNDENSCVCKDVHFEPGLKLQQLQDGIGKKCDCQTAKGVIKKKWSAAAAGRKRSRPNYIPRTHYCLKPGRAIWRGERRFYCIQTRFQLKNCKPCNPVTFIPTPL